MCCPTLLFTKYNCTKLVGFFFNLFILLPERKKKSDTNNGGIKKKNNPLRITSRLRTSQKNQMLNFHLEDVALSLVLAWVKRLPLSVWNKSVSCKSNCCIARSLNVNMKHLLLALNFLHSLLRSKPLLPCPGREGNFLPNYLGNYPGYTQMRNALICQKTKEQQPFWVLSWIVVNKFTSSPLTKEFVVTLNPKLCSMTLCSLQM